MDATTNNQTIALRQLVTKMVAPQEEALNDFCRCFCARKLEVGEHFVRAGEAGSHFAYVSSGMLRFYYRTPQGKEFNKSFATEHHFIGAYSAYLSGAPSRFAIEALEPSQLLVAKMSDLSALAEEYRCWENFRRLLTEQLYVRKEQREAEFMLDDAEQRYHLFQQRYPGLEERLAQYHIASYLGITPVTLSRIRTKSK